jgi:hypothetical protein
LGGVVGGVDHREECTLQVDTVGIELADDRSGVDDADPVGDPCHLVEVVAGDQYRRTVAGRAQQQFAQ